MFGLSTGHLLILLIVVLLFSARRLPELGGALGKGMKAFKDGLEGKDDAQRLTHQDENDPNRRG
jgi:sec-independent protein translocase protein TatA